VHKYQLLRQRADEFLRVLEEYAKTDPDVETFKGWFMPWYERIQRREIKLPCYDYKLGVYFANPDLSPLAERYFFGQPPNSLRTADTNFGEAIGDWLSSPRYVAQIKAAGEEPSAILDEQPPPEEEARFSTAPSPEPSLQGFSKLLHRWFGKR